MPPRRSSSRVRRGRREPEQQPAEVQQPEEVQQPAEVQQPQQPAEVQQPQQPAEVQQPQQPAEAQQEPSQLQHEQNVSLWKAIQQFLWVQYILGATDWFMRLAERGESGEQERCPVCLESLHPSVPTKHCHECNFVGHQHCTASLQKCPLCRTDFLSEKDAATKIFDNIQSGQDHLYSKNVQAWTFLHMADKHREIADELESRALRSSNLNRGQFECRKKLARAIIILAGAFCTFFLICLFAYEVLTFKKKIPVEVINASLSFLWSLRWAAFRWIICAKLVVRTTIVTISKLKLSYFHNPVATKKSATNWYHRMPIAVHRRLLLHRSRHDNETQ